LEAQLTVLGEYAELPGGVDACPPLVWLPGRGIGADRLGRACALLSDLPVELGPHGWKLADHPGTDLRRAAAFLREDVEALAIAASGYAGPLTVHAPGPWTMASALYLARGDVVLSDHGAVRELAASLAVGITAHVAEIRRQVPEAQIVVQLDESGIDRVLAGTVPTFSGYSRLRAVPGPDAVEVLTPLLAEIHAAGAASVMHVPDAGVGVAALAGAGGVGLRIDGWNEPRWTLVARAVERGMSLWAALPADPERRDPAALAESVAVGWRRIGLPAAGLADVYLLDDGQAPDPARARAAVRELGCVAEILGERAQG
jgi:hypothetical protein